MLMWVTPVSAAGAVAITLRRSLASVGVGSSDARGSCGAHQLREPFATPLRHPPARFLNTGCAGDQHDATLPKRRLGTPAPTRGVAYRRRPGVQRGWLIPLACGPSCRACGEAQYQLVGEIARAALALPARCWRRFTRRAASSQWRDRPC